MDYRGSFVDIIGISEGTLIQHLIVLPAHLLTAKNCCRAIRRRSRASQSQERHQYKKIQRHSGDEDDVLGKSQVQAYQSPPFQYGVD